MLTLALALMIAAQADPEDDPAEPPARSEAQDRAAAAKLISQGNVHLDAGRADEALRCFSEAYDLFASPTIYVSMAEAHLKLGNAVRAAELYQRFLEEKSEGAAAKLVMLAEQRLEELAAELAIIELESAEEGVLVSFGDDPIGETPLPPQYVKPGFYRISGAKDGFDTFKTTVDLAGGDHRKVKLELAAAAPPPVLTPPPKSTDTPPAARPPWGEAPPPPPDDGDSIASRWWFWTVLGAAVAGGVTVGVIAASSGGDAFVPGGELGLTGTSSWQKL